MQDALTNRQSALRSLFGNLGLMVVKIAVGVVGHSSALVADGIHSGADFLSSLALVLGLSVAGRPPDEGHNYGHAKAEAVSQKVVAVLLLLTGFEVGNSAWTSLFHPSRTLPSWATLAVSVGALGFKWVLYVNQRGVAKITGSHGIQAAATDNLVDAVSSAIAALGILATRSGVLIGDPVAALMVAMMVIWAGVQIFSVAARDLMDPAAAPEVLKEIRHSALSIAAVLGISSLRTRVTGQAVYVDLEIEVDQSLTLIDAHRIAHRVQEAVHAVPRVVGATVHVNPSDARRYPRGGM